MPGVLDPFVKGARGVCILDGGLGTELERHTKINTDLWSAGLLTTEEGKLLIKQAHKAFYEAGADVATSATYQASVDGFKAQGYSISDIQSFLHTAVALADEARKEVWEEVVSSGNMTRRLRPLVAASLGCYGAYLANGSEFTGDYRHHVDVARMQRFHQERLELLKESESIFELYAFETVSCVMEIKAILNALEVAGGGKDTWISMSLKDATHLCSGELVEDAVHLLMNKRVQGVVAIR